MLGKIEFEGQPLEMNNPNTRNLVAEVSTKETTVYGAGNTPRILALDCGMKANIVRYFVYVKKRRRGKKSLPRLYPYVRCCILVHLYVTLLVPLHSSSPILLFVSPPQGT